MKNIYAGQMGRTATHIGDTCAEKDQDCVAEAEEPCRASLRERVENQRNRSMHEARRAERLQELAYLMDKHPEIARMLDLLDEVRR